MKRIIVLAVIASLILAVVAVETGVYNMAATEKHWVVTEKMIAWVRDNSIDARAKEYRVPPLDDERLVLDGAVHYDAMCTICHLAPGMQPTELSRGLYPQAPQFYLYEPILDEAQKLEQAQRYFWVIKNGLKMTAMPAWGLSHDDDGMWAIVAFVQKLGGMTPEQYRHFVQTTEDHAHDHSE